MKIICIVCGCKFERGRGPRKLCSEACIAARRLAQWREYATRVDRTEYFRNYHLAHRDERITTMRARDRQRPPRPRNPVAMARYQAANVVALKIARNWHVPIAVARQMIEAGSLPP